MYSGNFAADRLLNVRQASEARPCCHTSGKPHAGCSLLYLVPCNSLEGPNPNQVGSCRDGQCPDTATLWGPGAKPTGSTLNILDLAPLEARPGQMSLDELSDKTIALAKCSSVRVRPAFQNVYHTRSPTPVSCHIQASHFQIAESSLLRSFGRVVRISHFPPDKLINLNETVVRH